MVPFDWQAQRSGLRPRERRAELQRRVDEWNEANPEIATPFGRENLTRAVGLFPHAVGDQEQMWIDRFTEDPDLMWRIVGDMVRFVSSDEIPRGDKTNGRSAGARMVQPQHRNLETVWRVLHGHFSNDPFPVAVRELIGKRSMRLFAQRAGFKSSATLHRYIRGERQLTMEALEAMAKAGKVDPAYFVEWRALWLSRELFRAMVRRPNESMRAVKMIRNAVI